MPELGKCVTERSSSIRSNVELKNSCRLLANVELLLLLLALPCCLCGAVSALTGEGGGDGGSGGGEKLGGGGEIGDSSELCGE